MALQHHQSGRLAEAEGIYRQILAVDPCHTDALHYLGVVAHQVGRNDLAVNLIQEAIALKPNFPEAHNHLGNAMLAMGKLDDAVTSYGHAIGLRVNYPDAHYNLAHALYEKGDLDNAISAYLQAIALRPGFPEAHSNLGNVLKDKGQLGDAIASYRRAIALSPSFAEAHCNLGNALKESGQLSDAIVSYHHAIALGPNNPKIHSNLADALRVLGRLDESIAACHQAIALHLNFPEAHYNLGNALRDQGQLNQAIAAYRHAIALRPDFPEAHSNLGNALYETRQFDEAITAYRQAIAIKPSLPEAHSNLGAALLENGQLEEAIISYRQAIALRPDFSKAHSNLVLALNCHPDFDSRAIVEEQRRWDQRHAEPLRQFIRPHPNDLIPKRRLRIGYVSADFREHPVGCNILPLFAHHSRDDFEIFGYAHVSRPDALTERFRAGADQWRSILGLNDEQLATQIRTDRIDILVDLSLHTVDNRLPVFARKPAPVQVTFAGYPGSTGLRTIDYRLSDPHLDPLGMDESFYSETTVRLPHTFWCYDPLDGADLPVNALPADNNSLITFGCLNNFCKVNGTVLQLWAKVLQAVPSSRLLLLAPAGGQRGRTLELFVRHGVAPDRIGFLSRQPHREYLELYHRIDIGLDTVPYNGHTTSLDSFWMGVPVVTLVGQTIVGRAGLSQLTNLNLPDLIASTPEQYVQIATDLAGDLPRLAQLRATLRERMAKSPLMDAPRFARDIETAYRKMWRAWCARTE